MALDGSSFTGSIRSRRYQGYIENGRRYQAHRDEEYFQPSDDPQWASQEAGHLAFMIMDCQRQNPLFRAELSPNAKYVLDLGTGGAHFPIDVADRNPNCKYEHCNGFFRVSSRGAYCVHTDADGSSAGLWSRSLPSATAMGAAELYPGGG